MTSSTPQTFAEVSAVTRVAAGRYTAEIDPEWGVSGNPNGGYLQAIMARAAAAESEPHPHVVTASSSFLSAPEAGTVDVEVEQLRVGRGTSQFRVRMTQHEQVQVETLFALSDLTQSSASATWQSSDTPKPGVPFDECPRFLPPLDIYPADVVHKVHMHLDPACLGFVEQKPRGLGELRGWIDLDGEGRFDPPALLLAADAFPPATFDVQLTGWVPTIAMLTYVRALPEPGPVQILFQANVIQGNRVDETCTVWDSAGNLVAQSHQLAAIRL